MTNPNYKAFGNSTFLVPPLDTLAQTMLFFPHLNKDKDKNTRWKN